MTSVSIYQRGRASYRLRTRWKDGDQWREQTYTIKGTRAVAEAHKRKLLDSFAHGRIEKVSKETVRGYIDNWITSRLAMEEIRQTTAQTYRKMLVHFYERFGDRSIVSLRPPELNEWMSDTTTAIGRDNARYIAVIVKAALKHAVTVGDLPSSPFDQVMVPKNKGKKKETALTTKAVKSLYDAAKDLTGPDKLAVQLALETGLRRGELAGLRWEDISMNGVVNVRRTIVMDYTVTPARIVANEPKTDNAKRRLMVSQTMRDELNAVRGEPDQYVFGGDSPRHPEAMSRTLRQALKRAGLSGFTAHDYRHAHATHLLRNGTPVQAVSRRLGHANVSTTLNIYGHALEEDEVGIVAAMDKLLRD